MTRRTLRLTLLFLNLTAVSAHAQDAQRDRPHLVFVTLANPPVEVQGELATLTEQAVAVVVDGVTREFPLTDVARIERDGDRSWDGALIAGTAVGTWCAIVCGQGLDDGGRLAGVVLANALVAAAIGGAFDRADHGRTTIFEARPVVPIRFALSLSPTTLARAGYKAVELEARVSERFSGGLGAGTIMGMPSGPDVTVSTPDERLVHVDGFARYFVSGHAFDGWSVGLRSGLTRLPGDRSRPAIGADIHRHWAIGRHVVGNVGSGLKRVIGGPGTAFDQRYVPWIKAHVGLAF